MKAYILTSEVPTLPEQLRQADAVWAVMDIESAEQAPEGWHVATDEEFAQLLDEKPKLNQLLQELFPDEIPQNTPDMPIPGPN